ncbi:MAG: AsmA family protein, partial [Alistipes sp.]|nr:AsmA family protein [Alistipes sp.]
TKDFRHLLASGELALSLWARGKMQGAVLPAFELKADVRNGSFQYSSLPKAVTDINIAARIANPGGTMDKTEADLSKFTLKMAGNSLSATAYATNLTSDPKFRAAAAGKVDLGAVKEVYPLDKDTELDGVITADVKLSGRMSDIEKQRYERLGASGTFVIERLGVTLDDLPPVHIKRAAATITPQAMTLGEFGVTVGRSDLAANGQLTDYLGYLLRGDKLSGRLYVRSELLDLNEIMAALPASDEAGAAPAEAAASEPMQAIEVPKNLNLSLNTDLHEILFNKMTISALTGEMRMAGGTLSLDKLALGLFGGKATASGSYSTAKDPRHPALRLSLGLAGASFSQTFEQLDMVRRLVPVFAKTGGDYSLSMDMSALLDQTMTPDLHSVNASGEIKSANIQVQRIAAFDALAKALDNEKLSNIEARDVAIRFAIRDGRVATQPFDLKVAGTNITLSGTTGLDQTIDYTARVAMPSSVTGGVVETLDVKIGGTFSSPKITLGVREAVEQAVKNIVDGQIEKLTGSESLSAEIEKQAENLRAEAQRAGQKLVAAAQTQRDRLVEEAAKKGALAKLAAQKAGDKLVEEAEKQAANLAAEADRQIEKLTAGK